MEGPDAMQLQDLGLAVRGGTALKRQQSSNDGGDDGSVPSTPGKEHGVANNCQGDWPTTAAESLCNKSLHSQVTKESTLSTRPRRLQLPPLPRRTDFGEHYPDGGWGWVICGAAFVVHFLCHGLHLASGTLFVQIVTTFSAEVTDTAWLCSASFATSCLMFPIVTAICRRKSVRLSAVVGGLITALGCLFVSFSTKIHQLMISTTAVLGIGTGLTLSSASIIIGRYFQRRRECAEMLTLSGSGVGMALMSVFIQQVMRISDSWMRSMQALAGLMMCSVVAGILYRSPSLYHPRRRAILHLQSLRKTKKQQRDFENKLPYLDFSPLRMRGLQVLMLATSMITLGTFVPFVLLPVQAKAGGISETSTLLLMVFMGVAFAFGCLLVGLVVIRSSLRCMVARRYLCQITAAGCGLVSMVFTMASGFNAFALFVWSFGLLAGGFCYSLKVYTYELVSLKLSERSWGYIILAETIPTLVGTPIALYLNQSSGTGRAGFLFAGISMVIGSLLLFFMPWASRHSSNHAVIQSAHLKTKTFDEDLMFLGMEVSENISSGQHRDGAESLQRRFHQRLDMSRMRTFYQNGNVAGHALEEEGGWSDIEAMSPMSPMDKVTEFLLHSQSMLQNYSQIHQLDLPNVRLEINNEYPTTSSNSAVGGGATGSVNNRPPTDEITDLKLEATIIRNTRRSQVAAGLNIGDARQGSSLEPAVSDVEAEPEVVDRDRIKDFAEAPCSAAAASGTVAGSEKQTAV